MIRLVYLGIVFLLISCSKNTTVVQNQRIIKFKQNKNTTLILQNTRHKKITKDTYVIYGDVELSEEDIEYSEPNYMWYINDKPNDPKFDELWGMHNKTNAGVDINAIRAWRITKGDRDIKIMVIDTGIDYNHPDLKENMWINEKELNGVAGIDDDNNGCIDDIHGCDYANNDGDPIDDHGHGTHCAGTIGAIHDNGIGVAGVMSDVTFVACKFLSSNGGTTENAIACIDYGVAVGVDIMSNSWGGGGASQALKEAIERARDAGILFVAAAGNSATDNDSKPHYPSNYQVENVISVAAYNKENELASFSCYGKRTVHIAAPGRDIVSTFVNGKYKSYSGTSMATPHVSGALGLLLSYEQGLSFSEIRERLMKTSVPVRSFKNRIMSGGRLDAYNLLMDIRPERKEPDASKWKTRLLKEVIESEHPYLDNTKIVKKIVVPGAKYIRLIVEKVKLELKYDTIKIMEGSNVNDSISGSKENYTTGYVEGNTLTFQFTSDRSVNDWGYVIRKYQYQ